MSELDTVALYRVGKVFYVFDHAVPLATALLVPCSRSELPRDKHLAATAFSHPQQFGSVIRCHRARQTQ